MPQIVVDRPAPAREFGTVQLDPAGTLEPAQGSAGGVGEAVVGLLPFRVEILASG